MLTKAMMTGLRAICDLRVRGAGTRVREIFKKLLDRGGLCAYLRLPLGSVRVLWVDFGGNFIP
jgi:hypothetical protein